MILMKEGSKGIGSKKVEKILSEKDKIPAMAVIVNS